MTSEQQRIAIAEWMGWKRLDVVPDAWVSPNGYTHYNHSEKGNQLPHYPNDLNAMHEAEKHGKLSDPLTYQGWLEQLTRKYGVRIWHATAAQRSEALCRTLWPERFEK